MFGSIRPTRPPLMRSEATERMGMAQLTSRARPKTMLPRMAPARAGIRVTAIAVDLKERKLVVGRGENLDYIDTQTLAGS